VKTIFVSHIVLCLLCILYIYCLITDIQHYDCTNLYYVNVYLATQLSEMQQCYSEAELR